jgi:hypothetical protein
MSAKRVLLLFWTHPLGVVEGLIFGVRDGFRALGWSVDLINTSDADVREQFASKATKSYDIAISFTSLPLFPEKDLSAYDLFGSRFFHWFVDPFIYDLQRFDFVRNYFARAQDYDRLNFLFPDRSYRALAANLVGREKCFYFPFAGELAPGQTSSIDRNDRYMVFATLGGELGARPASAASLFGSTKSALFQEQGIETIKSRLDDANAGVNVGYEIYDAFKLRGSDLLDPGWLEIMTSVDSFEKNRRRKEVTRRLLELGIKIDFYGAGWEMFSRYPNSRIMGPLQYSAMPQLLRQYRGLINFDPNWNDGYHDRVFMALSNGARLITSPNHARRDLLASVKGLHDEFVEYDATDAVLLERFANWDTNRKSSGLEQRIFKRHNWTHRIETFLRRQSNRRFAFARDRLALVPGLKRLVAERPF